MNDYENENNFQQNTNDIESNINIQEPKGTGTSNQSNTNNYQQPVQSNKFVLGILVGCGSSLLLAIVLIFFIVAIIFVSTPSKANNEQTSSAESSVSSLVSSALNTDTNSDDTDSDAETTKEESKDETSLVSSKTTSSQNSSTEESKKESKSTSEVSSKSESSSEAESKVESKKTESKEESFVLKDYLFIIDDRDNTFHMINCPKIQRDDIPSGKWHAHEDKGYDNEDMISLMEFDGYHVCSECKDLIKPYDYEEFLKAITDMAAKQEEEK